MFVMPTISEKLDLGRRMVLPYFLMAFLFVLNTISFSYPFAGGIKIPLILMAIYYWSVFRPTMVPAWLVFMAGCVLDLLSGLPLGINAFVFVAVQWVVTDQRRFLMGQPFIMILSGFCLVSAFAGAVQWALFGFVNLYWTPLQPVFISAVLGMSLFPLISVLLHLTHKVLPVRN